MPIIKSAKKRVKLTAKATARNARTKKNLRTALKSFGKKSTSDSLSKAFSALDTAAKKGLIHKNKVARKKRQLAAAAKNSGVKLTKKTATKTASKPATRKPAVKKPVAKKPATKK